MSIIRKFEKDDYELLDYTADYTDELTALSDTIATSTWILPSASSESAGVTAIVLSDAVTVDYSISAPVPKYRVGTSGAASTSGYTTTIFIDAGTLDNTYRIMNRITTAGGRHYSRVFDLLIARQGV